MGVAAKNGATSVESSQKCQTQCKAGDVDVGVFFFFSRGGGHPKVGRLCWHFFGGHPKSVGFRGIPKGPNFGISLGRDVAAVRLGTSRNIHPPMPLVFCPPAKGSARPIPSEPRGRDPASAD